MKSDKLSIRLFARQDAHGNKFFVGRIKSPATINLENGAAFLVFTSEEGQEEIQVACFDRSKDRDRDMEDD